MPYGLGGGATPRRPESVGAAAAGDFARREAFGVGGAAAVGRMAEAEAVAAGASSTGSPIEIIGGGDGSGVGFAGGAETEAVVGIGRFGSSVETAMTAAAVIATTSVPTTASPTRRTRLAVFGAWSTGGTLRIGRRPSTTSWAV